MNVLVGSDPELFAKIGDKFVSAFGLIPGTKEEPHPVEDGAVQVDGMTLEFNINPASTSEEFVNNIHSVMAQLSDMVPEHNIVAEPVAHFTEEYMDTQPDEAKELGCDPDYNAYTSSQNPVPNGEVAFRTGAGHVHIGFCEDADITSAQHQSACETLIKELDVYLGIPSVLFDDNTQRRELYGKAGAYRPKPYGVEYRVLSNKWLSSPALMEWVFNTVQHTVAQLKSGVRLADRYDAERIINSSEVEEAKAIVEELGLEVPHEV